MKAFLNFGLCLTLGLIPTTLLAQELQWRATGSPNASTPVIPAGGVPTIGLSKPVPLDDPSPPTVSPLKPIVRAQQPDVRPLPLGPLGDGKNPAPAPIVTGEKPIQKPGDFVAPTPKPVMPNADCCAPCPPCPENCGLFGCHILGCRSLFGHDGWLCHLWEPGCFTCNPCCDRPHAWISADYLFWTIRSAPIPPLVTASPAGTPLANAAGQPIAGVLGQPTTTTLLDRFDDPWRSGFRVSGGFWFHRDGCWGVDASFWSLGSWTQSFTAGGTGNPIIARPFNDVGPVNPGPGAELVAFPGLVNGAVNVTSHHNLWGAEVDLRRKLCCGPNGFLDALVGYRHFWLSEGVNITEDLTPLGAGGAALGTNIVSDRFSTSNRFEGAQFGLAGEWRVHHSRWTLAGSVRVGLGDMHEVVNIEGNQFFNIPPVPPSVQTGGILALPTNIGKRSADRFAVIPEIGLKLGYDLTPHLRIYGGYDFMYVSSVVRPGSQIDLTINRSQIPNAFGPQPLVGAARPAPLFSASDFWVQGFSAGLLWRY